MWVRIGFAIILLTACYHPTPATGVPCSMTGNECPGGQTCDLQQSPPTCVDPVDAQVAPPDAPECVTSDACDAAAPVCDPQAHVCRGCIADVECDGACTEYNGLCIPRPHVIFVSATGSDSGSCTDAAPCKTFGFAFGQLTNVRRTIRVADGDYAASGTPPLNVPNSSPGRIEISGEDGSPAGANLTATSNGTTNPAVVQTSNGTDVVIEGVNVHDGGQDGIRSSGTLLLYRVAIVHNSGRGLSANSTNQAAVHVWDSQIADNGNEGVNAQNGSFELLRSVVVRNNNGGVQVNKAAATIVGSMIVHNGNAGSTYGGLRFQGLNGLPQVVSFTTVANNLAGASNIAGLQSDVAFASSDSMFVDNGATDSAQISGGCTATYSLFSGTVPVGTGNIGGVPLFVNVAVDDYHLAPTSPARDAADPAGTVRVDLDGDPRPSGAGFDIGADEIP